MNKMTLVRKGYKRRGLVVEELPSKLGNFLGKSKWNSPSLNKIVPHLWITDGPKSVRCKIKRYATRGQFKQKSHCWELRGGRTDRDYMESVFLCVCGSLLTHIPLLFLSHSFSPLVGFQGNLTTLFPFVFILVIQRSSYGTCISNGLGTWEMRKWFWNDDCFLLPPRSIQFHRHQVTQLDAELQ